MAQMGMRLTIEFRDSQGNTHGILQHERTIQSRKRSPTTFDKDLLHSHRDSKNAPGSYARNPAALAR